MFVFMIFFAGVHAKWPGYVAELDVFCPMSIIKNGFDEKIFGGRLDFPLNFIKKWKTLEHFYWKYNTKDLPWVNYQGDDAYYFKNRKTLQSCFMNASSVDCFKFDRLCQNIKKFWPDTFTKLDKKNFKYEVNNSLATCYYFCVLALTLREMPVDNFRKFCPDPCRNNPCRKVDHSSRKCM